MVAMSNVGLSDEQLNTILEQAVAEYSANEWKILKRTGRTVRLSHIRNNWLWLVPAIFVLAVVTFTIFTFGTTLVPNVVISMICWYFWNRYTKSQHYEDILISVDDFGNVNRRNA